MNAIHEVKLMQIVSGYWEDAVDAVPLTLFSNEVLDVSLEKKKELSQIIIFLSPSNDGMLASSSTSIKGVSNISK